jgi:paraquat-inducible protein B
VERGFVSAQDKLNARKVKRQRTMRENLQKAGGSLARALSENEEKRRVRVAKGLALHGARVKDAAVGREERGTKGNDGWRAFLSKGWEAVTAIAPAHQHIATPNSTPTSQNSTTTLQNSTTTLQNSTTTLQNSNTALQTTLQNSSTPLQNSTTLQNSITTSNSTTTTPNSTTTTPNSTTTTSTAARATFFNIGITRNDSVDANLGNEVDNSPEQPAESQKDNQQEETTNK